MVNGDEEEAMKGDGTNAEGDSMEVFVDGLVDEEDFLCDLCKQKYSTDYALQM